MNIDTEPKLNSQKKEEEIICENMRQIAKKFPKPSGAKIKEKRWHGHFGNNFKLLFLSFNKMNTDEYSISYLERIEKSYGNKWKKFVKDNIVLLSKIQEILIQEKLYDELGNNSNNLIFKYKNQQLAKQIYEEVNLEGIHNDIWNKLNPLLQQASEIMVKYGIKTEEFYD